jgi:hypothetical protein
MGTQDHTGGGLGSQVPAGGAGRAHEDVLVRGMT